MINMGCLPWAGAYLRMPFRGKITTAIYQTTQRKNVDPGLIFCFRWAYQGYDANSERLMRKLYCLRGRDKWELGAPSRCLKWMHAYTVTSQLSGEWPVLWWCDICSSLTPGVSHRWCTEVLRTANRICIGYRVTAGAWIAAWHTYCSPPLCSFLRAGARWHYLLGADVFMLHHGYKMTMPDLTCILKWTPMKIKSGLFIAKLQRRPSQQDWPVAFAVSWCFMALTDYYCYVYFRLSGAFLCLHVCQLDSLLARVYSTVY